MLEELKNQVYEANMELQRQKLVVLTWGNVSGIDRNENLFVIKPSGVKYEELTPEKMVVVDLENNVVEGEFRPSFRYENPFSSLSKFYQYWRRVSYS